MINLSLTSEFNIIDTNIMASLLKAGEQTYNQLSNKYSCDENEGKMCYSNVKHWIKKLQKEDKVDVYWVRDSDN